MSLSNYFAQSFTHIGNDYDTSLASLFGIFTACFAVDFPSHHVNLFGVTKACGRFHHLVTLCCWEIIM